MTVARSTVAAARPRRPGQTEVGNARREPLGMTVKRESRFALLAAASLAVLLAAETPAEAREAQPAAAQESKDEGVIVRRASITRRLVPADTLEKQAQTQYLGLLNQVRKENKLAPDDHPAVKRVRAIAQRIVPFAGKWNERIDKWQWEVNVINAPVINAFCMPGGKIMVFTGILDRLKMTDDEVAMVMGHEMAHALREHARARIAKTQLTASGAQAIAVLLGLGSLGQAGASAGAQLLTLRFNRNDETESDLIGMELAARAGYDPRAGISLWEKMAKVTGQQGQGQWLSTHPSGPNRIASMQKQMDRVLPIYARTKGLDVKSLPPYVSNIGEIKLGQPRSAPPAQAPPAQGQAKPQPQR
jgi:Zn-dependent protease with chaperone function